MLRTVVLFAVILAVQGSILVPTTNVSQCTRFSVSLPINTYIEGCESPPCQLIHQQDTIINITFRAPREMQRISTLAAWFISIIPMPIPHPLGPAEDTCTSLNGASCPVSEGEILKYTLIFHMEEFIPVGLRANLELRLVDESNSPFLCLLVPIEVVAP